MQVQRGGGAARQRSEEGGRESGWIEEGKQEEQKRGKSESNLKLHPIQPSKVRFLGRHCTARAREFTAQARTTYHNQKACDERGREGARKIT